MKTAHEAATEMGAIPQMTDPPSAELPFVAPRIPTDDEMVESQAQAQFTSILENKKQSEIRERVVARIHELAKAAGLKPQTEDEILKNMILTNVEKMRHAHLEQMANRLAEKEFSNWVAQQRKTKK